VITAGDLDSDGDIDVLVGSDDYTVAWFENSDGKGTFGAKHPITEFGDYTGAIAIADMDGDADNDILASVDAGLTWFENTDGVGTFGAAHFINTRTGAVLCADVDGDGDADIIETCSSPDEVLWYENTDGLGSFGPPLVISTAADGPAAAFAADLDGDGDTDVLSASRYDNTIAWYENTDGLGAFGPMQVIDSEVSRAQRVFAADLDGDGDNDVLAAGDFGDTVAWFENTNGLGIFGPRRIVTTAADGPISIFATDLDGDGDIDVLSASHLDFKIAWYENTDGTGTFGVQQIINADAGIANGVLAADLDGDGDADVLSSSTYDDVVAWYENEPDCNGNGLNDGCEIAANSNRDCNGNLWLDECDVTYGLGVDCNSNGKLDECDIGGSIVADCNANNVPDECDLASGSSTDCNGNALPDECDVEPVFPGQTITTGAPGVASVFASDLDGDGDIDVLSAAREDNSVAWYENTDGLGAFGAPNVLTSSSLLVYYAIVFAADLDSDGDTDALYAASGPDGYHEVVWFENTDGLGSFGPEQVVDAGNREFTCVVAADMDGDHDVDIVVTASGYYYDYVLWYENVDGLGTFGAYRTISQSIRCPHSVQAADMDGDGDIDVVVASRCDHRITWYVNSDGLGTFVQGPSLATEADHQIYLFVADLDGDADIDVLSASVVDHKIAWYENVDGLGDFGPRRVITSTASGASSVFAADMDGDSDLDVLSASSYDAKIAWYENTDGQATFGEPRIISLTAGGAAAVFAADLNGDGYNDVLSAAFADDTVTWYRNVAASRDCNDDDVPDECQPDEDCNGNAVRDLCDIGAGTSDDCNFDLVPDECQPDEDCNGNAVRDLCDLGTGVEVDCNRNLIPDSCDLAGGGSFDDNGDGVPDECCEPPPPVFIAPSKSRYLSLESIGAPGVREAIRVTFVDHAQYPQLNGQSVWVGMPRAFPEEDSSQPGRTFHGAGLSCRPYFQDWTALGPLHVYGAEISPGSSYEIQLINESCPLDLEANYSSPSAASSGTWGDVAPPFAEDAGAPPQPDFGDIAAVVQKFTATPSAPIKALAQLQPNVVFPQYAISFKDISVDVAAFVGSAFTDLNEMTGPCGCPSVVKCRSSGCLSDVHCPDGYCIDGFCTDACGRCTPP